MSGLDDLAIGRYSVGIFLSLRLSRRRQNVELHAMSNVHQIFLPVNQATKRTNSLAFLDEDKHGVQFPNNDLIVISMKITVVLVYLLLVDNRSFCNILFKRALDQIRDFKDYIES